MPPTPIALADILSPDGQDPARWRVKVTGHAGSGIMCGVLFTDGVCAEPVRDTQARKLMAAIGNSVVVTPWDASPVDGPRFMTVADILPADIVARIRGVMERYPDSARTADFGEEFFCPQPAPPEMPTAEEIAQSVQILSEHLDALEAAEAEDAKLSDATTLEPGVDDPAAWVAEDAAPQSTMPDGAGATEVDLAQLATADLKVTTIPEPDPAPQPSSPPADATPVAATPVPPPASKKRGR